MNGYYTLFKRNKNGTRGQMVTGVSKVEITLKWRAISKFTLQGVCVGKIPLSDGDSIIIYRNSVVFLEGIISTITTECKNPDTDVRTWKANGEDLNVMFSYRYVLGNPLTLDFDSGEYDKVEDTAWNRILHYIRNSIGTGTIFDRQLFPLTLPERQPTGTVGLSSYRKQALDKVLDEIGKENDLYPILHQDEKTGTWSVAIPEARDMTEKIFISPVFGNVTSWTRTEKKPEFTAVWALSGSYDRGQLYVYLEDKEAMQIYGRIEKIITKSDLVPHEEEEITTEVVEDKDKNHLTEADVLLLLEHEAVSEIREHGQKVTWSIEAAETHRMAFMEDWQLGDLVTCILDGEKFASRISQVKISYAEGIEKVEPTIGNVVSGVFGEIFDMIKGLDRKVIDLENS